MDRRRDPLTGAPTVIVGSRQGRPNQPARDLPATDCPFCPGGLEAPDDYAVRSFVNRWPAMPDDRCEMVLYTPEHDAEFWTLGHDGARRVIDLWAQRTAELGARNDVDYVLIFENRGPEVGATIAHPHGQIYAYADIPPVPMRELIDGVLEPAAVDESLVVTESGEWQAWVPAAARWPYELRLAPRNLVGSLADPDCDLDGLASVLIDSLARLDQLFDEPMPYMLWIHQRPTDGDDWPRSRVHVHIAPANRGPGLQRFVASAEVGGGVYFNPVDPLDAARALRDLPGLPGLNPSTRFRATRFRATAPGRVNLIGDHTDYMGGLAMPMAVQLATTIEGTRREGSITLRSVDVDGTLDLTLPVGDPAAVTPPWGRYVAGVAAEVGQLDGLADVGLDATVSTTIPLGSGLSSSAALEIAAALALGDPGNPLEVARRCQRAEQLATGVPCGIMDQLASAAGVAGAALLMDCAIDQVTPVPLPTDAWFWVLHSGQQRELVGSEYATRRAQCEEAEALVGPLPAADLATIEGIEHPVVRARARHVRTECIRVERFADAMNGGDLVAAGALMTDSHRSLRDDFGVSTHRLDVLVDRLIATDGVLGARLTGAGFGGCVVALTSPGTQLDGWRVLPGPGARIEWLDEP